MESNTKQARQYVREFLRYDFERWQSVQFMTGLTERQIRRFQYSETENTGLNLYLACKSLDNNETQKGE